MFVFWRAVLTKGWFYEKGKTHISKVQQKAMKAFFESKNGLVGLFRNR